MHFVHLHEVTFDETKPDSIVIEMSKVVALGESADKAGGTVVYCDGGGKNVFRVKETIEEILKTFEETYK